MTATSHLLGAVGRTAGARVRRIEMTRAVQDRESVGERTEGAAPMRAAVLLLGGHLGEGASVTGVGHEDRVVPEPAVPAGCAGDRPLDGADRGQLASVGEARYRD